MNDLISRKVRVDWVDALRALAIIFVIYGHCKPQIMIFYVITSPIKIPLFFVLSGFLFNLKTGDIKKYMYGIWIKLIVPWLLLSGISFMPWCVAMLIDGDILGIIHGVENVMLGVTHWFMPCFIIGSIIHFVIRKYIKHEFIRCIVCILFFFVGVIFKRYRILNECMINLALNVQLFFYIGYCIKNYYTLLQRHAVIVAISGMSIYFAGCILTMLMFPETCLDVHKGYYYDIGLCLLLIIVGNVCALTIASKMRTIPAWLSFIGRNSLVIYMLQGYGFIIIAGLLKITHVNVLVFSQPLLAFFKMVIVVSVCSLLSIVINRYAPIITGGRK